MPVRIGARSAQGTCRRRSGAGSKALFPWERGPRAAAATGAIRGLGAEFQRTIDSLSWLVGLAVFLTWWGPYLIGLVNLVLSGCSRS